MNSLLRASTAVLERDVAERVGTIPRGFARRRSRGQSSRPADLRRQRHRPRVAPSTATATSAAIAGHAGRPRRPAPENALAVEAGDRLRGAVPEPDERRSSLEEDAVAHRLENLRRVLALGRERPRSRLGLGELRRLHLRAHAGRGLGLSTPRADARSHAAPSWHESLDEAQLRDRVGRCSLITCTTPTTAPSCLTGTIIADCVGVDAESEILRTFPSPSTS